MVEAECMGEEASDWNDDSWNQKVNNLPSFHLANIQNLMTSVCGEKGYYLSQKERISFLREQSIFLSFCGNIFK